MSNRKKLQDIVKGRYGRKIAYTDVETITENNIISVLGETCGAFTFNKSIVKYLWDYYKGDQPILYRTKVVRDDLDPNNVVENHAWEIVQFKTGQTYGEPIQVIAMGDNEQTNALVDKFNDYLRIANKSARDIECGLWQSAVGFGYKAVLFNNKKGANIPFLLTVPTPMDTYIVYSRPTKQPLMAVQELKDEDKQIYKLCFTDTHIYKVKNGEIVETKLNGFQRIPIVEYPNNPERISDIELVISMLDAINNMQSNRMDAVEQFVQSWVKFINCDIDSDSFKEMKKMGAISVKQNTDNGKADVDIMSQELKQSESQIAKQDLWDNVLSISAIPNKQGNSSGDTQGAVQLRNGWDFSKQRARMKDPFVVESERAIDDVILNVIKIKGNDDVPLSSLDYDIQISHSPTDNMLVKAEVFQMLVQSGIHPLVAIKACGLWNDPEKVYTMSKPYLDAIYQTLDEKIEQMGLQEQLDKANELIEEYKNGISE